MNEKRLYLKDQVTGEVFAVAVDTSEGKPIITGAARCTRAEEMVLGALAVLPLEHVPSDLATLQSLYAEHKLVLWVAPEAPSPIMHKLIGLREELGNAQNKTMMAKERLTRAKAEESEIEQQIFAVLATLHEPQVGLPFDDPPSAEFVPSAGVMAPTDDLGNPEPVDLGENPGPDPMDVAEVERDLDQYVPRED